VRKKKRKNLCAQIWMEKVGILWSLSDLHVCLQNFSVFNINEFMILTSFHDYAKITILMDKESLNCYGVARLHLWCLSFRGYEILELNDILKDNFLRENNEIERKGSENIFVDGRHLKKITTYRSRQKLPRSLVLVLSINKYYNPHCLVLD